MDTQNNNYYGFIRSMNGGVITAESTHAGEPIAVLNVNSSPFQKWKFTNEGYIVLESPSPLEFCLSAPDDLSNEGIRVYLEPKATNGFLQKWGYNREANQFYLLKNQDYLLDNGSGGTFGPIVYVSRDSDSRWSLPVD